MHSTPLFPRFPNHKTTWCSQPILLLPSNYHQVLPIYCPVSPVVPRPKFTHAWPIFFLSKSYSAFSFLVRVLILYVFAICEFSFSSTACLQVSTTNCLPYLTPILFHLQEFLPIPSLLASLPLPSRLTHPTHLPHIHSETHHNPNPDPLSMNGRQYLFSEIHTPNRASVRSVYSLNTYHR